MIKKQLLILVLILGYGISLQAMHLQQFLGQGYSDFGVLKNPSKGDKEAYEKYVQAKAPIVLAMNACNISDETKRLVRYIEIYSNALGSLSLTCSLEELEKYVLKEYVYFWGHLREIAVFYSARGSIHVPKHDDFNSLMAKTLAKVIHGHCTKRMQLETDLKSREADLKKEKEESAKYGKLFVDYYGKSNQLDGELKKLKEDHRKLAVETKDFASDSAYRATLLGQAVDAMNVLEKSEADLKIKVEEKEKEALKLAQEKKDLKKHNEELQEQRNRSRQEKAELTERFEKDIARAANGTSQLHERMSNAMSALRKEISPLRRQISPLRRQVASQTVILEQKDAEIARLRQALRNANIQNNK